MPPANSAAMTAPAPSFASAPEFLTELLQRQRQAALADGMTPHADRIDRLRRLEALLVDHQKAWCEAVDADFGGRPAVQTRMEISGALESIRYAIKHLRHWMKPERRPLPLPLRLIGARAEVLYQPLGVIGVVSPWNFPLVLSLGALGSVFAAGNRAMLKPSELSPATSALMKQLLESRFDAAELVTVLGGADVGQAFCRLPFDHLLFTGAPAVAKHVLHAAAEHLVPTTLELGGKNPVVIGPEADLDLAADRIILGKLQNAGQICLSPDYVFVPKGQEEAFIALARQKMAGWYTRVAGNPDYCSIINGRHYERLQGYVDEAKRTGVRLEVLAADTAETNVQDRRMPVTIFVEPDESLRIMQDEVFGPLFSLRSYRKLDEVIDFINARPRPLALYYFGSDATSIRLLKERTTSGGMTINDIFSHAAAESLPLGGVGNSGMGRYHGRDGFVNFSHPKAILQQRRTSLARMFNPPYTAWKTRMLDRVIGKPME